jgi:hypothetical protein
MFRHSLHQTWFRILFITSSVIALLPNKATRSCGPYFEEAIYTYRLHPALPLKDYAAGKIEILKPTFARSYLMVAYRWIQGNGFDRSEQHELRLVWNPNEFEPKAPRTVYIHVKSTDEVWKELADSVDFKPKRTQDRTVHYGSYWWDLRQYEERLGWMATENATNTLTSLIARFGLHSNEARSWVEGERLILETEDSVNHIPAEAPSNASLVVRQNRQYQRAAGYFYEADYNGAARMFQAIAEDDNSPWQALAAYLVARSHLRNGMRRYHGELDSLDLPELALAKQEFEVVEKDPRFKSMKEAAREIIPFVLARLEPDKRLHDLSHELLRPHSHKTLFQNLVDYRSILDHYCSVPDYDHPTITQFDSLPKLKYHDDMTDWIRSFQFVDKWSKAYARRHYDRSHNVLWLSNLIMKASGKERYADSLVSEALSVPDTSKAYVHLRYHAARLLIELGRNDSARRILDEMIAIPHLTTNALNDLRALRLEIAGTLDDFVTDVVRKPIDLSWEDSPDGAMGEEGYYDTSLTNRPEFSSSFDADGAQLLNVAVPLNSFLAIVEHGNLPDHLKRDLSLSGWTRAILLDSEATAVRFATLAKGVTPKLASRLSTYLGATSSEERHFTAIDLLAHAPGCTPLVDTGWGTYNEPTELWHLGDNWWRRLGKLPKANSDGYDEHHKYVDVWDYDRRFWQMPQRVPPLVNSEMNVQMAKELGKLRTMPVAVNYLGKEMLAWATRTPGDKRIPEDLHLVIEGARWSTGDSQTEKIMAQLFRLLHKRYKKTHWAKITKYYFANSW